MRVEITWVGNGKITKETCRLAAYDAKLYSHDGEELPDSFSEEFLKAGFVMFEDDEGMFMLKADQIKEIKQL